MRFLPVVLFRIVKAAPRPDGKTGTMSIIIRQPYAHLADDLRRIFEGREDVHVMMDRRHTNRRTSRQQEPLEPRLERRRADRRRPREELVEVVISE